MRQKIKKVTAVHTYAHSALPFARNAHLISTSYAKHDNIVKLDDTLTALARLDTPYDATSTFNRVARRTSLTQGIALLMLYVGSMPKDSPVPLLFHPH
jgi:hypothetical protein